jgi:chaperone required for assembly of F1-ATPase
MKRFWKEASLERAEGGFVVQLDGRPLKTPVKASLILYKDALAQAVLAEWNDAGDTIDPSQMPMTGFANAAIDKVTADINGFVDTIAAFGESDLMCYRASEPDALVARQAAAWDPWLRWAQARYFLTFTVVVGIMHKPQPVSTITRLKEAVAGLTSWQLAAASRLVPISGSLVALLALTDGAADAGRLWSDLIVDELWQEEKWGADEYAIKNRNDRQKDFMDAARFLELVHLD